MLSKLKSRLTPAEDGFTLIEILVTIVIIGILAAIAIPIYLNQVQVSQVSSLKDDVSSTADQLASFYNGQTPQRWPSAAEFTPLIVQSDPKNVITLHLFTASDNTVEACVEGDRVFSATKTVTWSYSLTSKSMYSGPCVATPALSPEVPN
jgi:prepilin-type N-terminal cleavage/methylation domain-containing protein